MKVLLVHKSGDSSGKRHLHTLLKKMNVLIEDFPVGEAGVMGLGGAEYLKLFSAAPYLSGGGGARERLFLYALVCGSLPREWLTFLAGLALGSGRPFLVYGGEAAAALPEELEFCFTPLATDISVKDYFEAERKEEEKEALLLKSAKAREGLFAKGVSVTEESLARCVEEGRLEDAPLFFMAGFSPDTREKHGIPLLNLAARKGNEEMLRLLLGAGADINLVADDRGSSALIDSAIGKYPGIAEILVKAGADPNIRSKDGQSALVVAVGSGDAGLIKLLLDAGADADVPDTLGLSARKYAALFHQESVMELFDAMQGKAAQ